MSCSVHLNITIMSQLAYADNYYNLIITILHNDLGCGKCHSLVLYNCDLLHNTHRICLDSHSHNASGKKKRPFHLTSLVWERSVQEKRMSSDDTSDKECVCVCVGGVKGHLTHAEFSPRAHTFTVISGFTGGDINSHRSSTCDFILLTDSRAAEARREEAVGLSWWSTEISGLASVTNFCASVQSIIISLILFYRLLSTL